MRIDKDVDNCYIVALLQQTHSDSRHEVNKRTLTIAIEIDCTVPRAETHLFLLLQKGYSITSTKAISTATYKINGDSCPQGWLLSFRAFVTQCDKNTFFGWGRTDTEDSRRSQENASITLGVASIQKISMNAYYGWNTICHLYYIQRANILDFNKLDLYSRIWICPIVPLVPCWID